MGRARSVDESQKEHTLPAMSSTQGSRSGAVCLGAGAILLAIGVAAEFLGWRAIGIGTARHVIGLLGIALLGMGIWSRRGGTPLSFGACLWLGVRWFADTSGIYVALASFTLAGLGQTVWLIWRHQTAAQTMFRCSRVPVMDRLRWHSGSQLDGAPCRWRLRT